MTEINIKKKLQEITHKVGNIYHTGGTYMLLARVGPNEVTLICLKNGNRIKPPYKVKNDTDISQEEFAYLTPTFAGKVDYIEQAEFIFK